MFSQRHYEVEANDDMQKKEKGSMCGCIIERDKKNIKYSV